MAVWNLFSNFARSPLSSILKKEKNLLILKSKETFHYCLSSKLKIKAIADRRLHRFVD